MRALTGHLDRLRDDDSGERAFSLPPSLSPLVHVHINYARATRRAIVTPAIRSLVKRFDRRDARSVPAIALRPRKRAVDMQMSRRRSRLGVRKVETKSQRDPLRRVCPSTPPLPPRLYVAAARPPARAPSCLAQMKFSATLHSNAIKARIAS